MSNLQSMLSQYQAVVFFDTETTGLDADSNQIIELAALRVEADAGGIPSPVAQMDTFIRLPDGKKLPEKIVELTGITDELLLAQGVTQEEAAEQMADLMS